MKNRGDLAFERVLIAVAVVLTSVWVGSAVYTWPKAETLTEIHNLPYPQGPGLGRVVSKTSPDGFQAGVQNGTILQARTLKVVLDKSLSHPQPPFAFAVQGKDKEGLVWEAQILGETDYLNFLGLYPHYVLEEVRFNDDNDNQVISRFRLDSFWWGIHALLAAIWALCAFGLVSLICGY